MTVRKKVQQALLEQMRAHGGTLAVEKDDRLRQYTRVVLKDLAKDGRVEVEAEDARRITYRLPLCREALWSGQSVLWQHKGAAIPATVVRICSHWVEILVRDDTTGEETLHQVRLSTLHPLDDQP